MSGRNRIYGPVPSRRLGLSLGIDLVEYKHCPLDCIYCQLKETTRLDSVRETPATVDEIVEQVRDRLSVGPRPDHLTLGGSGEPTLYGDLGPLISRLRDEFGIPVALLTNGVLFSDPETRAGAALADVVLPSLDAWDESSFQKINRPCDGLSFKAFMDGMVAFRREFRGRVWLEVMLLEGISDDDETVSRLAELAATLNPDKVQLNTPIRPPATSIAAPLTRDRLMRLAELFSPPAEVAADFPETPAASTINQASDAEVMEMITRRPCTAQDVAVGLAAEEADVKRTIDRLLERGAVVVENRNGRTYFKLPA